MTTPELAQLDWLLKDFVDKTPRAESAVLASLDGIILSSAELSRDEGDRLSAVISGLLSLSSGIGRIRADRGEGGEVRQICIEGTAANLFLMSAGAGLPRGMYRQLSPDLGTVGTVLGVLTAADADAGVIGYGMATLVKSVAEHLVTPTRRGATSAADGH